VRDQYVFSIGSKDIELIEIVKRELRSEHPIYQHEKKLNDRIFISHELTIGSKQLVTDLVRLGCVKNKSASELSIPDIPKELISHFIRGYFDGDGGVCVCKPYGDLCIYFTGCQTLLAQIQQKLEECTNVRHVKIQKHGSIFKLNYKGNGNAKRIREYLYSNALLYLSRKQQLIYSRNPKAC